jgi:DNA-binding LacI/PurR family transcriptional regulator
MLLALGKGKEERIEHALDNFFGGRVRGIIAGPVVNSQDAKVLQSAIDRQIPLVIFSNLERIPLNFVALDQAAGARIMLEHLYQLGHRKIFYIGGILADFEKKSGEIVTRSGAYIDFMKRHGLKPEFLSDGENYGITRRTAYDVMNHILKTTSYKDLPTAILAHNDDAAMGALLALQQAKIRVPEDISLTGFDDIAESSYSVPSLTTIGGVMETQACELVDTLERIIQNGDVLRQKFITPKLIIRESTAVPRKEILKK